jgi:hypothetical protein
MTLRLTCIVDADFDKITGGAKDRIAKAATDAMRTAAVELKSKGRSAIAAGISSTRFANAFSVKTFPQGGVSLNPAVSATHKIPYAGVFEDGATISGKPMLWLPIDGNLPLQARGKRWSPKDFISQIGPLRKGAHGSKPLLFGQVAVGLSGGVLALPSHGVRARKIYAKAKKKWLPLFVGVSSITEKKKFDLYSVARDVASGIGETITKNLERDNG